jgi:hypothetical protein
MKFLLTIIFFAGSVSAQNNIISIQSESTTDGNILINATNYSTCTYTVVLRFSELSGFSNSIGANTFITSINEGKTQILKLIPEKNGVNRTFHYNYTYYSGSSFRKALLGIALVYTTMLLGSWFWLQWYTDHGEYVSVPVFSSAVGR